MIYLTKALVRADLCIPSRRCFASVHSFALSLCCFGAVSFFVPLTDKHLHSTHCLRICTMHCLPERLIPFLCDLFGSCIQSPFQEEEADLSRADESLPLPGLSHFTSLHFPFTYCSFEPPSDEILGRTTSLQSLRGIGCFQQSALYCFALLTCSLAAAAAVA